MEPEQLREMNDQLTKMMNALEEFPSKKNGVCEFSEIKEITRECYAKLRRQLVVCVADELHEVLGSIERSNPDEWDLLHRTLRYPLYFPREEMDYLLKSRLAHRAELKQNLQPENMTHQLHATAGMSVTETHKGQMQMLQQDGNTTPLSAITNRMTFPTNVLACNDTCARPAQQPQLLRPVKAELVSPPKHPKNPYAEYAFLQSTPTQFFIQPNASLSSSTPLQMPKHNLPLLFKAEPRVSPPQLPEQPQLMPQALSAYAAVPPMAPVAGRYTSVAVLEPPKEEQKGFYLTESGSPAGSRPAATIRKSPNSHFIAPPFVTNYSVYTRKTKTPIQVLPHVVLPKNPTAEQIEISVNPYFTPQVECENIADTSSHSFNRSFGSEGSMMDTNKKTTRRRKPGEKRLEKLRKFIPPVRIQQFVAANTFVEDGVEAVMLGLYGTAILKSVLYSINWTLTGPAITRKILIALFDRQTLADNSLTGKPSPAFPGFKKPPKGSLKSSVIDDIIFFLTNTFPISEKEVRSAVTTKCADENKMRRNRATKVIHQTDAIQNTIQMEVDVTPEPIYEHMGLGVTAKATQMPINLAPVPVTMQLN